MIRRHIKTRIGLNTLLLASPPAAAPMGALRVWAVLPLLLAGALTGYASSTHAGDAPAPNPEIRIPVTPLGYDAPGMFYMLSKVSLGSLDFVDSKRLLFTFREVRLLPRMNNDSPGEEQMIHALILNLPGGRVSASADWLMPDRNRYLWPLGNGRFLIRRGDTYYTTDASLELHAVAGSPTPVRLTEVSPDGRLLIVEEDYEPTSEQQRSVAGAARFGQEPPVENVEIALVDLDTNVIQGVFRAEMPIALPVTSAGYLGVNPENKDSYQVSFIPFRGNRVNLGSIVSSCTPQENFLSSKALLIESCMPDKDDVALDIWTIDGKKLWHGLRDGRLVWPTFARAQNGSKFAVGLLRAAHLVNLFDSLNEQDVKQQLVQVFNTQTGALLLSTNASPILAAGQNFALSPDGSHLAVLRDGAIEIYNVPANPAPLPTQK